MLSLSAPLAMFAIFNYIGDIFDILIATNIGTSQIASLVFIDQIRGSIAAFGTGIAAAGIVLVGRHYGANELDEAKKTASTSFILTIIVAVSLMILFILLGKPIMLVLNAPKEIIDVSMGYFNVQMITTCFIAINAVFFGLEKAKGNTPKVFLLNVMGIVIRLSISSVFILVLKKGFIYMALGNLIAQGIITMIGIFSMFNRRNPFQIQFKKIQLNKQTILPILSLALPIFLGSMLFNLGKILINSMAAFYGTIAIASFGVSMKIVSIGAHISAAFEETESLIISQNIGNKSLHRSTKSFFVGLVYVLIVGIGVVALITIFQNALVTLFSRSDDPLYYEMIHNILKWEKYSAFTSALLAIFAGFFNGFKRTRFTFVLNVFRLYVFRIPLLFLFISLNIGYESLGYVMFISNTGTAIIGLIISIILLHNIKKHEIQYIN